jgi:lysyl-tRNA synthetase class 2
MSSKEEELYAVRKSHAEKLNELGARPYPSLVLDDVHASDRERAEAVRIANDPIRREKLPTEADLIELKTHSPTFDVYGRVIAKRGPFLVLRTRHGDIQALVRADELEPKHADELRLVDLGDHVRVRGPLMRTKTGDAAVRAREYEHVSKALLPPPDKWHGLADVEKRYRERYVDLFANPGVAEIFRGRALIVRALRAFLDNHGFLEVETPLLHPLRGGATARPFETHHHTLDMLLYLRIAPELYLKRLLVGGLERVYEIGRCFRNEGISTKHNPEFSILEFYMAYANYEDLMTLTQQMLRFVDHELLTQFPQFAHDRPFRMDVEWERVPMVRSLLDATQLPSVPDDYRRLITEPTLAAPHELAAACEVLAAHLRKRQEFDHARYLELADTHGKRIFCLFEIFVEAELANLYRTPDGQHSRPVFIVQYPADVSPLARRSDVDGEWVDRFELFVEGRELANAFNELNDPEDQASRFTAQLKNRDRGDVEAMDYDADYIRALSHGMPPAAGFGLGVDRLAMLLLGQKSIRDVLLFPLLRPAE